MFEQIINAVINFLGAEKLEFWKGFIVGIFLMSRFMFFQRNAWLLIVVASAAAIAIWLGIINASPLIQTLSQATNTAGGIP